MNEDMKTLIEGIHISWDAIAYDIPQDSVKTVDMIELATDANRLAMFAGQKYEDLKDRMLAEADSIDEFYTSIAKELHFEEYEAGGSQV